MFSAIGLGNGLSIGNAIYFSIKADRPDDIPFGLIHWGVIFMGVLYLIGAFFYVK